MNLFYCIGWLLADTIETYAVHPNIFYHHDTCKQKCKRITYPKVSIILWIITCRQEFKSWYKALWQLADSVSKWKTNICLIFMCLTNLNNKTWGLNMDIILKSCILPIQACNLNSGIVTSLNVHFTLHSWLTSMKLVFTLKIKVTPWNALSVTNKRKSYSSNPFRTPH